MKISRAGRSSVQESSLVLYSSVVLAIASISAVEARAVEMGRGFASPEEAVSALARAASTENRAELRDIFGPAVADLINPDQVQATNEIEAFADNLNSTNRIVRESDTKCELEVGADSWPFPVPIVKQDGRWFFDTVSGKDELLNRRIGRNELDVLKSMRAYVDAQREYAGKDRMGDDVLQYAQRIASTPGKKDGLYWPADLDGSESPLGPLVAEAVGKGYNVPSKGQSTTRAPFHGYYFKILTQQGKDAPGGKYNYIINGRMIAGFAMIAWPAEYGNTGVMTFIVNQQGRVYQRDLGEKTEQLAPSMTEYDPGLGWTASHE